MEAQAGDPHPLVAADEGIGLLLADPFGEAVRLLGIVGVLLVEREIIEARRPAVGEAYRIDARGLADLEDAVLGGGAQRVVAADHVVVMDDVVGVAERMGDRSHVDDRLASLEGGDEPVVIARLRTNEAEAGMHRCVGGSDAVDADDAVAAPQGFGDDGAADAAAAAGQGDPHRRPSASA